MTGRRVDFDAVKASVPGRSKFLAQSRLGLTDEELSGKHVKCPFPNHGVDGDFRFDDRRQMGNWICTCDNGDLIDLIKKIKGCTFTEAMFLIYEALNGSVSTTISRPVIKELLQLRTQLTGIGSTRLQILGTLQFLYLQMTLLTNTLEIAG